MSRLFIIAIGSMITVCENNRWYTNSSQEDLFFEQKNIIRQTKEITEFKYHNKVYYVKSSEIKVIQ